jgi:hypothetical protein
MMPSHESYKFKNARIELLVKDGCIQNALWQRSVMTVATNHKTKHLLRENYVLVTLAQLKSFKQKATSEPQMQISSSKSNDNGTTTLLPSNLLDNLKTFKPKAQSETQMPISSSKSNDIGTSKPSSSPLRASAASFVLKDLEEDQKPSVSNFTRSKTEFSSSISNADTQQPIDPDPLQGILKAMTL